MQLRRVATRGVRLLSASGARPLSTSPEPVTPDFTTSVNVADIRLSKPQRAKADTDKRRSAATWDGLDDLAKVRGSPHADGVAPLARARGRAPPIVVVARAALSSRYSPLSLTSRAARAQRTRGSLVDSTLAEMENDAEFQMTAARLREVGAKKMSLEERKKRRRALDDLGVPDFWEFVEQSGAPALDRRVTETLQVNIGLYCNQACGHCHVESSPKRAETMSAADAARVVELIANTPSLRTLDITGGAPELAAQFRPLVRGARAARPDLEIIDRCNLTVLSEPGQEDLVEFLAEQRVHVIASLPCYSAKNVNMQRGSGVFDRSISALLALNERGYGAPGSDLTLDLVYDPRARAPRGARSPGSNAEARPSSLSPRLFRYNPLGAFLPPPQEALEAKYKEELEAVFGVVFNGLFTITNMPIKRFADFLHRRGELKDYMELLVRNFNPSTVDGLMCRSTVSVAHDGALYDCDFNQQLLMGTGSYAPPDGGAGRYAPHGGALTVHDVESLDELLSTEIVVDSHCFGCTAGMGSS